MTDHVHAALTVLEDRIGQTNQLLDELASRLTAVLLPGPEPLTGQGTDAPRSGSSLELRIEDSANVVAGTNDQIRQLIDRLRIGGDSGPAGPAGQAATTGYMRVVETHPAPAIPTASQWGPLIRDAGLAEYAQRLAAHHHGRLG